jgi:hypothetical protein
LLAFYIEGFLSFSLPAMATGVVAANVDLTAAADFCGEAVILMVLASIFAITFSRSER